MDDDDLYDPPPDAETSRVRQDVLAAIFLAVLLYWNRRRVTVGDFTAGVDEALNSIATDPNEWRDRVTAALDQIDPGGDLNWAQTQAIIRDLRPLLNGGDVADWASGPAGFRLQNAPIPDWELERNARTEATRVYGDAAAQYAANQGHTLKLWQSMQDPVVRDSHQHLDGMIVPVNELFPGLFSPLRFPGDPTADLREIINCRCVMLTGYEGEIPSRRDNEH